MGLIQCFKLAKIAKRRLRVAGLMSPRHIPLIQDINETQRYSISAPSHTIRGSTKLYTSIVRLDLSCASQHNSAKKSASQTDRTQTWLADITKCTFRCTNRLRPLCTKLVCKAYAKRMDRASGYAMMIGWPSRLMTAREARMTGEAREGLGGACSVPSKDRLSLGPHFVCTETSESRSLMYCCQ